MSHRSDKVLVVVAAAAIVVAITQTADAQRGGRGMRGMFPVSTAELASLDAVQSELKLTDEQKEKATEISGQLRNDRADLFRQQGGDPRQVREEMEKLNADSAAKLGEVLDETQQKRLLGISIQVNAGGSLSDPAVISELGITAEQIDKLEQVRDANREDMRDAFRDTQDLSREERMAKFEELRAKADEQLFAVLTPEQQSRLEQLKGDPVEVDLSSLRGGGRGGPGGPGGRRGGRGA